MFRPAARISADPHVHASVIRDQFTRQAPGFAAGPQLHAQDVLRLIVDAAAPGPQDRVIDLACGPGSVACAMAQQAAQVVGLDATPAMLDLARKLAQHHQIGNVAWIEGSIYRTLFEDETFAAVTCRFAFHHLEEPEKAFAEMVRLAAPGGRIVLCDGIAPSDPAKRDALNAMERYRDPSTVAFRPLEDLCRLFADAGLGVPMLRPFQIPYLAEELAQASFPEVGDRADLVAMIEDSVADDAFGMEAHRTDEGVRISYPCVALCAVKPA